MSEQPDGPAAERLPDHTGEVVVVTGMTGAGPIRCKEVAA